MRKALYAALAAATVLVLTAPANQAVAAPANVDTTAENSSTVTPAQHRRHRHYPASRDYWLPPGAYWSPRHYWYDPLNPDARYYVWGPYWGHYCYNPGRSWGWPHYLACYM